jgi:hypothetical protein
MKFTLICTEKYASIEPSSFSIILEQNEDCDHSAVHTSFRHYTIRAWPNHAVINDSDIEVITTRQAR